MNARILPPLPVIFILFFSFSVLQCAEPLIAPQDEEEPPVVNFSAPQEMLVNSQNRFGLKLFSAVNAAEEDAGNLFISPLSVSMALGMTMNGASGDTRTAMEQTLEFAGLTEEAINETYLSLIDLLTGLDPDVALQIANSIWYRDTFPISPAFVDINRTYFYADVEGLDFSSPEAAQIINSWVDEKTNGKISQIVEDPIDPLAMMFLINAIYFKGIWTYQFDPDETQDGDFYLPDDSVVQVPMMKLEGKSLPYYYNHEQDFRAAELAYGDSLFSMTILIPGSSWDINSFIGYLDQAVWDSCITHLNSKYFAELRMPKFKIEYEITLNEILKAMGMEIAFDPSRADFSRMASDSSRVLYIDEVKHKTFVEVNEEGTEAAAVTSVVMTTWSGPPMLVIDSPFVFAIRERSSGTILFIGKVINPSS